MSFDATLVGLTAAQRDLLAARLRARAPSKARLVAYAAGDGESADLSAWLAARLPSHMVPDAVEVLHALPRLPNGKIDARALAQRPAEQTAPRAQTTQDAPGSEAETVLAGIWSALLDVEPILGEDNFFELGGDSLLSIRMISMARQEGLAIAPADLTDYPTLRALAQKAESGRVAAPVLGATEAPVLSIQAWHLTRGLAAPAHWNQAVRLKAGAGVTAEVARKAFEAVIAAHPGFAAQFREAEGWRQDLAAPDFLFETGAGAAADHVARMSARFELDGPLLGAVHLEDAGELLIVAHHLTVDAVSWGIILDDLRHAAKALIEGRTPDLATATSPADWAVEVASYATSDQARSDVALWLGTDAPIAGDYGTEAEAATLLGALDPATTEALLGTANEAFNTKPLDLIVWALAEAMAAQRRQSQVQIDLEGHGRQPHFSDMDLSRTVSWLTSYFPVNLPLSDATPEARGKAVKEALRAATDVGASFGAVRYGGPEDLRTALAKAQTTDVLLNYTGPQTPDSEYLFATLPLGSEGLRATQNDRAHLYEFNVSIQNGALQIALIHGRAADTASEASAFLTTFTNQLKAIVQTCTQAAPGGFTPSDFAEAGMNQDELDAFLDEL